MLTFTKYDFEVQQNIDMLRPCSIHTKKYFLTKPCVLGVLHSLTFIFANIISLLTTSEVSGIF